MSAPTVLRDARAPSRLSTQQRPELHTPDEGGDPVAEALATLLDAPGVDQGWLDETLLLPPAAMGRRCAYRSLGLEVGAFVGEGA